MSKNTTIRQLLVASALLIAAASPAQPSRSNTRNKLGAFSPAKPTFRQVGRVTPKAAASQQAATMPVPIYKVKGGPELWGVVEYSSAWEGLDEYNYPSGVYSFLASNPTTDNQLLLTGQSGPNGGGVFYNGQFNYLNYTVMYDTQIITYTYKYDISTWEQANYPQYGSNLTMVGTDETYDATTGNVYGYFYDPLNNEAAMQFGTISYGDYGADIYPIATDNATADTQGNALDSYDNTMICLAADQVGQLWGISWSGGLWKIDKTNGQKTLVDYTGVRPSSFRQSATFDPQTGKLYWTAFLEDYKSALYEVNTTTGVATKLADLPDDIEVSCLYIPEAAAADDAPAAITDLALNFEGPATAGQVTFTLPAETYAGDALTGELTYSLLDGEVEVASGTAAASTPVTLDVSLATGWHDLTISTSNAHGRSPQSAKVSRWIGYDQPEAPTDVTLSIDNASRQATITWQAPTSVLHEGFFDASHLTYNVTRQPGGVVVATGLAATTYSQMLPEGPYTCYTYDVVAVNGTTESEPAKSNGEAVGSAFNVPYSDDFSTDDTYGLYTVVNVNGDERTWGESNQCFAYFYSWSSKADDWLLTPPIHLEGGKSYAFAFDIKGSSSYDEEKYSVAYGMGTSVDSYTQIIDTKSLRQSNYLTERNEITAPATGDYRFGIHLESDSYKGIVSVDNILVEEVAAPTSPGLATDITVTPAAKGALEATISFQAPAVNELGEPISSLSSVAIYREEATEPATIISNPAPGSTITWTDTEAHNGINTYRIVASNEAGDGKLASASAYVGIDAPTAVTGVRLAETTGGATLTWDAPSEKGQNDGYVDTDALTYNVYDPLGNIVAEGLRDRQWTLSSDLAAEFNIIYFGVAAANIAGTGEVATSNYIVTGPATELPFAESFAHGNFADPRWWTYGSSPINSFSVNGYESEDHDMGSAQWSALGSADYAYLCSGRITARGTTHPMLSFSHYIVTSGMTGLSVTAELPDGSEHELYASSDAQLEGEPTWQRVNVELDEATRNADHFVLRFMAFSTAGDGHVLIDNIVLRDVPARDLKLAAIESPASVTAADSIVVTSTVANNGYEANDGYTLTLYMDDDAVATRQMTGIEPFSSATVAIAFKPTLLADTEATLRTEVTWLADTDPANNLSQPRSVTIERPQLPAIDNLANAGTEDNPKLTWTRPTAADAPKVTDDFDTYSPWAISGVGSWKMVDGDQEATNTYTGMWYPHIGDPMAYIVFNPNYGTMCNSQREVFTAHSGEQSLAAIATLHDYTNATPSDDWLITPRLSGKQQKVAFWVKSLTDYKEDFAVYSAESDDLEALKAGQIKFEKFGASNEWTRYEYEVPEGHNYFALCYTSNLSGILIDDFEYEGAALEVEAYKVYRDEELIATLPATQTAFIDPLADEATHYYTVTVVYKGAGESDFSNFVSSKATGIGSIEADAEGADTYNLSGMKMPRRQATSLPKGVYIKAGKKVVVK